MCVIIRMDTMEVLDYKPMLESEAFDILLDEARRSPKVSFCIFKAKGLTTFEPSA